MDERINENPVIILRHPSWPAPMRRTLDQVFDWLWPLHSDTKADIRWKLSFARRLPTSHPAIRVTREQLIEALTEL